MKPLAQGFEPPHPHKQLPTQKKKKKRFLNFIFCLDPDDNLLLIILLTVYIKFTYLNTLEKIYNFVFQLDTS